MIEKSKYKNALYALQTVILRARTMAYKKVAHKEIAAILDEAEFIPYLIAADEDKTVELGQCLEEMAQSYSDAHIFNSFKDGPPLAWARPDKEK